MHKIPKFQPYRVATDVSTGSEFTHSKVGLFRVIGSHAEHGGFVGLARDGFIGSNQKTYR